MYDDYDDGSYVGRSTVGADTYEFDEYGIRVPMPAHRPTWAEVNLDAAVANLNAIREKAGPDVELIAVVKADAYGHGTELVQTYQSEGITRMAVAFVDEAIALRQRGIDSCDIMLLGLTLPAQIPELLEWDIEPTVDTLEFAKQLSDYCSDMCETIRVHVKVDTGMGRIGFRWDEAAQAIAQINELPNVRVYGVFTHFATADEADKRFTELQMQRFDAVLDELDELGVHVPLVHADNSAGIMEFDHPVGNAVRPGIILYGLYPSNEVKRENLAITPVMTFKTQVMHLKTIHKGDSCGYGRKFIADGDRRIATLPVGYADGYSRMLSGKGTEVYIRGHRAPVVGNICMDQCTVDVTDVPDVALYDEVELFGEHIPAEELAERLGTIDYEVTCMVNKRVPRIYTFMGEKHLSVEILNDGYGGGL